MSVIWKYLNKRSGAIDAIRDYDSMKFIIENTSEDIYCSTASRMFHKPVVCLQKEESCIS